MPRDGSGAGDNAIEAGETKVHGAGSAPQDDPASSGVDRSSKAAPLPSEEKGGALEGMNASGGGSSNGLKGSGHGEKDVFVDKEAERLKK